MTQFEAPRAALEAVAEVRSQLVAARQKVAALAIELDCATFPELANSLRLIADTTDGALMMTDEHMGRYKCQEPEEAVPDPAKAASAVAIRAYQNTIGAHDPSRAPSRSASVSRAAARMRPSPRRI